MAGMFGAGYFDFCLLDTVNETTFHDNLKARFRNGDIYTYIGEQVVSVNPFQRKQIYGKKIMENYLRRFMYEVEPHIYALADDTFRALMNNKEDQCVLITGESGAGKTEASKIFMEYITYVSRGNEQADAIKDKLLESNPVLEAFGNAKTLRNDNSSRFGKYMEIQFDYAGAPQGGRISQYLLEKSRVVTRGQGERSFHIFYQLLTESRWLGDLYLTSNANDYQYLRNSGCIKVQSINDGTDFADVKKAVKILGWSDTDLWNVCKVLAAILHLGNVTFTDDPKASKAANTECVKIADMDPVNSVAYLLEVDAGSLEHALKNRSISTGVGRRQSHIYVPLNMEQAVFARDSLAKNLYHALFTWVVDTINKGLISTAKLEVVIGVLDIYGFEIMEHNSFEQLCINYCNEKLQQLFIENVLRSEQEEYRRENIKWTKIDYFDNQPIIELIEGIKRSPGLFPLLDECCLVGKSTATVLLEKYNANVGSHPHYTGSNRLQFKIAHYAGDVVYNTESLLEKNRDEFYPDLLQTCQNSGNSLVRVIFPPVKTDSKSRPKTSSYQFQHAVCDLVDRLRKCQPHYIRCIKSNDEKRANFLDEERVRHQCLYLNLVETVRVRRAGFCNRQPYVRFLWRYKMLSDRTWPVWRGSELEGTKAILASLQVSSNEYALGTSKLFIKNANTFMLFEIERTRALPLVAIIIQKVWRGYKVRSTFYQHKMAMNIVAFYRAWKSKAYLKRVQTAFAQVRTDPQWGRNTQWPKAPSVLRVGEAKIKMVARCWWAYKKVMSIGPEERQFMRQKVLAMDLFRGNKPWNCSRRFEADYLDNTQNPKRIEYTQAIQNLFQTYGDREILYSDNVEKINPTGKSQTRTLIVTDSNIYKYDPKKYVVKKEAIPLVDVEGIFISKQKDTFVVVKMASPLRDVVINVGQPGDERVSEFVTVLYSAIANLKGSCILPTFDNTIRYNNSRESDPQNPNVIKVPGHDCTLLFSRNPKPATECSFMKGKNYINTVLYPE